jgi:hypothetical protein
LVRYRFDHSGGAPGMALNAADAFLLGPNRHGTGGLLSERVGGPEFSSMTTSFCTQRPMESVSPCVQTLTKTACCVVVVS